jgi:plasmid stabilization system protein ParE
MARRFIIRPRAERDIQSAYDWYESREAGLGEEFLKAVRNKLESIRDLPQSCPIIYRDVRLAVVSRFPYLIFYFVQSTQVSILAMLHHSRNPDTWPRR